jgi:hypothetical protein
MHEDLIVAREGIHETEQLIFRGRVYQCIDTRERKAVFRTGFVEVSEVYTHPPFAVGFLH